LFCDTAHNKIKCLRALTQATARLNFAAVKSNLVYWKTTPPPQSLPYKKKKVGLFLPTRFQNL